ncbi:hypothetical protein AZ007_002829 [Citrobacter freundii]|nr:hypothetical protein AZ007_002829 [Citrobacter freundii]
MKSPRLSTGPSRWTPRRTTL